VTTPRGTAGYTYHATKGTLTSITSPDGATLAYTYDGFLPLSEAWSGTVTGTVSRAYNDDFRMTQERVNGSFSVNFAYDADGLLTAVGYLTLTRNPANGSMGTSIVSSDEQARASFGRYRAHGHPGGEHGAGDPVPALMTGADIQKTETLGGLRTPTPTGTTGPVD
jgi:hypothetical protein